MSSSNYFPTVDIFATQHFAELVKEAASALGIAINHLDHNLAATELCSAAKQSSVITFIDAPPNLALINLLEREQIKCAPASKLLKKFPGQISISTSDRRLHVLVARSPHGQIASWTPASILHDRLQQMVVVPAPDISESELEIAQNYAIKLAGDLGLIGVLNLEIEMSNIEPNLTNLEYGPNRLGLWTLHGSITSQFEQHLRAILDLPLGDTALRSKWTVTGDIQVGDKQDMYRPYLHLMARTPEMKFWQSLEGGFLSISGDELTYLKNEIEHARLYFKGDIEE